jgi:putative membrane protein
MSFESYQTLKSLHIIFMVSWFAGLFYIVRLYIYHTEAQQKEEIEKEILSRQFIVMERKLWWIITTPAMILTLVFGFWMLHERADTLFFGKDATWMHIKLSFVVLLLCYHFTCQKQLFDLKKGIFKWSSTGLRIWNEVATLCLVAIVFIVEMGNGMNWLYGTIGFFGVAIGLMIGIRIYKLIRNRNAQG